MPLGFPSGAIDGAQSGHSRGAQVTLAAATQEVNENVETSHFRGSVVTFLHLKLLGADDRRSTVARSIVNCFCACSSMINEEEARGGQDWDRQSGKKEKEKEKLYRIEKKQSS